MPVLLKRPASISENTLLSPMTTFGLGGPARYFIDVATISELADCLLWARDSSLDLFFLGNGSNVLFSDEGFDGLVVRLKGEFKELSDSDTHYIVGAGVMLPFLGKLAIEAGFGDFLFMCGIPATVGGALFMNAGTNLGSMSEVVAWVEVLEPSGKLTRLELADLHFAYRTSVFSKGREGIITRVAFKKGEAGSAEALMMERVSEQESRVLRQPKCAKNAGSIFKNPPTGPSAGALIEGAGLKGLTVGGAMVAFEHANWIINIGGASSSEVKSLIDLVKIKVFEEYDVELLSELIVL
jgi:UDP-N-acetylmuramate dehydrogenase